MTDWRVISHFITQRIIHERPHSILWPTMVWMSDPPYREDPQNTIQPEGVNNKLMIYMLFIYVIDQQESIYYFLKLVRTKEASVRPKSVKARCPSERPHPTIMIQVHIYIMMIMVGDGTYISTKLSSMFLASIKMLTRYWWPYQKLPRQKIVLLEK